ncbi:hypothetical protein Syun_029777 [Stephania yunnanensis]|uniref:Uncharacterized protein n=1 Tax=Stephania yunnanensis TaxID=152371 RepID=A0AAP0EDU0_9MAGN
MSIVKAIGSRLANRARGLLLGLYNLLDDITGWAHLRCTQNSDMSSMHATLESTLPALVACHTTSLKWSTSHSYDLSSGNSVRMSCMHDQEWWKMQCRLNTNGFLDTRAHGFWGLGTLIYALTLSYVARARQRLSKASGRTTRYETRGRTSIRNRVRERGQHWEIYFEDFGVAFPLAFCSETYLNPHVVNPHCSRQIPVRLLPSTHSFPQKNCKKRDRIRFSSTKPKPVYPGLR